MGKTSPWVWAAVGGEVLGVGLGIVITPTIGIVLCILGLCFFYPAINQIVNKLMPYDPSSILDHKGQIYSPIQKKREVTFRIISGGTILILAVLILWGTHPLWWAVSTKAEPQSVASESTTQPSPKFGLYFKGEPLEGQRIPIKMETERISPPIYHISLWDIEIREEGRKAGAHISTPRWRLSEKDVKCLGACADGDSEPSDSAKYPTVFRGQPFQVDVGGKWFIRQMTFVKHGHPASEIYTDLELSYGTPDPIHATFTIVPSE